MQSAEKKNFVGKVILGTFLFVLTGIIPFSCSKEYELPGDLGEIERPGGGGEDKLEPVQYVTGVGFPDGFDWRKGNYDEVQSYILVFRDGKKYRNFPIGEEHFLSSDPDMHRLVGGDLYADYSLQGQTVISKNGKEKFRYEGTEMIAGFLVKDEDIYTLGVNRKGVGIAFRKNGKVLFEDSQGFPIGDIGKCLYEDEGDISFVYRRKYENNYFGMGSWYVYSHGRVTKIHSSYDTERTYAVRMIGGKLCKVVTFVDQPHVPFLVCGEEKIAFNYLANFSGISSCQLITSEDQLYIKIRFGAGENARTVVWNQNQRKIVYDASLPVYDFYFEGENCHYIVQSRNQIFLYENDRPGKYIPEGYQMTSTYCASLDNGKMCLALSPCDYKEHPILWKEGEIEPLPFKGYVTSVVTDYVRR